jgi:NADH-quinone oxidoreductase subunit N
VAGWTSDVWALLAPMILVCGTALLILALDLFTGKRRVPWSLVSLAGLVAAAVASLARWQRALPEAEAMLGGSVRVDNLTVFLYLAILLCTGLCLVAVEGYPEDEMRRRAEFYVLALLSATGMMLLVSSGDLITMFLGLELLSFPTYVLCGYRRHVLKSNEAALKYFVLGSFASSIFLYGVALLWGATGTTSIPDLRVAPGSAVYHLGALLVVIGFLFKVGAAPFHMWVPDVYEGAPTPVTAFMATAVKVAAFGAFLRVMVGALLREGLPFETILWWLAVLTMVVGNMSALTQDNIKRMLAFSSVAHAGYMLVGLTAVVASGWDTGAAAILYYLIAYAFMNIGAFTVVVLLGRRAEGELNFERDWSGVARRHPFLALAMAVFMLGLGGIPPTSGFFGKYSLFKSAMDSGLVSLVVVAVLNSLVSVYYYLRVVVTMYMRPERAVSPGLLESLAKGRAYALQGPGAMAAEDAPGLPAVPAPPLPPRLAEGRALGAKFVVVVCLLATLWLGFGPSRGGVPGVSRVMKWAETAVASLR